MGDSISLGGLARRLYAATKTGRIHLATPLSGLLPASDAPTGKTSMPGLAFLRVTSSRVARATACWVIVAILARPTASALGDGQPYLVKDINPTGYSLPMFFIALGDRAAR